MPVSTPFWTTINEKLFTIETLGGTYHSKQDQSSTELDVCPLKLEFHRSPFIFTWPLSTRFDLHALRTLLAPTHLYRPVLVCI